MTAGPNVFEQLFAVYCLLFSAVLLPVQQHSVPQNITGFEFKLIGPLTLKQFGYLAGAGILVFMYWVAIGGFLKWLFIIPTALLGPALALVPLNGMSLDRWIVALIKAVLFPSIRVWHKESKQIGFLAPEFSYYLRRAPALQPTVKPGRARLESYLSQLRASRPHDKLERLEQHKLSSLPLHEEGQPALGPRTVEVATIKVPEEITATPLPQEVPELELTKKLARLGVIKKEED